MDSLGGILVKGLLGRTVFLNRLKLAFSATPEYGPDSLCGILTWGLLGNPIIAQFSLSLCGIIDVEIDTTGGHSIGYTDYRDEEIRGNVRLKINIFNKTYEKVFTFSDNKINILVSFISYIKKIKEMAINIKFRKTKIDKIQVKFNEKD